VTLDTTADRSTADAHLGSLAIHGDVDSFPAHAELVRTLLHVGRFATLTTNTTSGHAAPGFPYGSFVAYSVLDDGSPLLCISDLAEHTRNARADARAGMLLSGLPVDDRADPLDRPRASLVGRLASFEPSETEVEAHVELHPGAVGYVDFDDFGWWRLSIDAARYIGGFGHMSWVSGADIAAARPDSVLAGSSTAVEHMNADHADAVLDMAHVLAGITDAISARVHAIDRHGMTLYADRGANAPLVTARVAFVDGPLASADDVRGAVVALARRARERAEESE